MALRPRLSAFLSEDIGGALNGGVKVCQRNPINEVRALDVFRAARYRPSCDRNTTIDDFFRSSRPTAPQLSQSLFTKKVWTQDPVPMRKSLGSQSLTRLRI